MDCELINSWQIMDLTGADIKACAGQFAGRDFSGAKLNGVDLGGANLNGTKFVQAELNEAHLEKASLVGADLSLASLLGANLKQANLTNATLYGAFLSNDTGNNIRNAASLVQAHLKNANLSFAHLSGVNFTFANLYGDIPTSAGACKTAQSSSECNGPGLGTHKGFACHCASARGAVMRQTNFSGAYLYGLDFTEATMQSVNFTQAVLTGANLTDAVISSDPQGGKPTNFYRTFLQGTNLAAAKIRDVTDFTDAFVDFRDGGNNIFIYLDGDNHNQFACSNCSPGTGNPVCVLVNYPVSTLVPRGAQLHCPGGGVTGDCGPPVGSNTRWRSTITNLAAPPPGVPPAWYLEDSTYIPANPRVCAVGSNPPIAPILEW
jgi:uncharacterized protein YjbI with pentapeptide repeats